jgi:hypothetical protein
MVGMVRIPGQLKTKATLATNRGLGSGRRSRPDAIEINGISIAKTDQHEPLWVAIG